MSETKQPVGPYHALCVGAGGANGYQLLGVLHYFYTETNWMKDIRIFAGTSVGACISGMLAIGYTPEEALQYLCVHDVNRYFQIDLLLLGSQWGVIDTFQWKTYVTEAIVLKYGSDPTLQELFDKTGHTICFATWCLTQQPNQVYITTHTHPNIRLSQAIVMSTTIPCIFTKCEYEGQLYVDGGIFDTCPTKQTESLMLEDERLLVIRLSDTKSTPELDGFMDYMKAILGAFSLCQVRSPPVQGDEIIVKTDFSGVSLQVETTQRVERFKAAFKRIKYQLFLPKVKIE
jgi:predicted acylesterase/phospholipase RssA